ncbi:MAG: hypothetical protein AB1656_07180 [Candidatus Omnitrophota bacterium]
MRGRAVLCRRRSAAGKNIGWFIVPIAADRSNNATARTVFVRVSSRTFSPTFDRKLRSISCTVITARDARNWWNPKWRRTLTKSTIGNRLVVLTAYWHYALGMTAAQILDNLNYHLQFALT